MKRSASALDAAQRRAKPKSKASTGNKNGKKVELSKDRNAAIGLDGVEDTLYVRNLDTKIAIADLRASLLLLFSTYGRVVAVNANRSARMHGQAHVGFATSEGARAALSQLQGTQFLGRPLVIAQARTRSHRIQWLANDI